VSTAKEHERNRGGDGDAKDATWKVTFSAELTLQAPEMLLVLESCFLDDIDCSDLLENVPIEVLLKWVLSSCILLDGLNRMNYWERYFQKSYPLTYQRLSSSSHSSQERARAFLGNYGDTYWRGLWCLMVKHQPDTPRVWKETLQRGGVDTHACYANTSTCGADEFGLDNIHQLLLCKPDNSSLDGMPVLRTFAWNASSTDSVTQSYFDFNNKQQDAFRSFAGKCTVMQAWSIPFADACLVLFHNRQTGCQELVWVAETNLPQSSKLSQDLRYWTLNRNILVENSDDFVVPAAFDGGSRFVGCDDDGFNGKASELHRYPVLVATTEDCTSVVIGGNVVLVFDKEKKTNKDKNSVVEDFKLGEKTVMMKDVPSRASKNWRQSLLTEEFLEPNRSFDSAWETTITACCYVLDAFLLVATNDGVLRAHPRSNLKSEYFVENVKSLVSHMTSLYNVVAIVHSYHVLEVRHVIRVPEDPFVQFSVLYQTRGVDCDHPPLLYGPYVLFAGLDGCWYRVLYDTSSVAVSGVVEPFPIKAKDESVETKSNGSGKFDAMDRVHKEEIGIPYHAGWRIVSIITGAMSELLLFANGAIN
jgi:hypothetical protein